MNSAGRCSATLLHTGVDARGISVIDRLSASRDVKLVALFSPEHGLRGALDRSIPDGKDEKVHFMVGIGNGWKSPFEHLPVRRLPLKDKNGKIVLPNSGVAQGGLIDTPDGKWYALLFQDNAAVGRVPVG